MKPLSFISAFPFTAKDSVLLVYLSNLQRYCVLPFICRQHAGVHHWNWVNDTSHDPICIFGKYFFKKANNPKTKTPQRALKQGPFQKLCCKCLRQATRQPRSSLFLLFPSLRVHWKIRCRMICVKFWHPMQISQMLSFCVLSFAFPDNIYRMFPTANILPLFDLHVPFAIGKPRSVWPFLVTREHVHYFCMFVCFLPASSSFPRADSRQRKAYLINS